LQEGPQINEPKRGDQPSDDGKRQEQEKRDAQPAQLTTKLGRRRSV
jgi:hypothetical protein